MPSEQGDVAIFWDLGEYSIHCSLSSHQLVDKIRELSQQLGTVKSFRGYAELMTLGAPDAFRWRSELQASGVSLIDCPAIGCRSSSSKTMIVDMLLHATDNPPPVTFLIIAGDDDFAYAISTLRLRRYEIVLVCPKRLEGQYSLATTFLDWQDVFGVGLVIVPNLESGARGVQHSSSTDDTETPSAVTDQRSVPFATEPLRDYDSALRDPGPGSPAERDQSGSPASQAESITSSCRKGTLGSVATSLSPTQSIPQPLDKEPDRPLQCITAGGPPHPFSVAPSHSTLSLAPTPSSEGLHPSSHCQPSESPWHTEEQTANKGADHEPSRSYDLQFRPPSPINIATNSSRSLIGPLSSEYDVKSLFSSPAYVTSEWANSRFLPANSRHVLSTSRTVSPLSEESSDTVVPSAPSIPRSQAPPALYYPSPALAPTTTTPLLTVSFVPTHFAPLVAKLQAYRSQGNLKPFRPGLAAEIVSLHSKDMHKIGASTFTQYAQAAERAGIVELSKPGEGCWVALRPEFYDYPTE